MHSRAMRDAGTLTVTQTVHQRDVARQRLLHVAVMRWQRLDAASAIPGALERAEWVDEMDDAAPTQPQESPRAERRDPPSTAQHSTAHTRSRCSLITTCTYTHLSRHYPTLSRIQLASALHSTSSITHHLRHPSSRHLVRHASRNTLAASLPASALSCHLHPVLQPA